MDTEIITAGSQQYQVAGWPQRVVARGLDIGLIMVGCALGGEMVGGFLTLGGIVYLFLGSGLMSGASLGKRAMGLKVIEARHGGPCSVMQDLIRQRYLLYYNPVFIMLIAYDSAKGCFDRPETYVVHATPMTAAEREVPQEKPAKLDLAGMGDMVKKMREARDGAALRDE